MQQVGSEMNKKLGIVFAISQAAGESCHKVVKKLIDGSDEILIFSNTHLTVIDSNKILALAASKKMRELNQCDIGA